VRPFVSWKLRDEEWIKSSGTGLPVAGDVVGTGGMMTDDWTKKRSAQSI